MTDHHHPFPPPGPNAVLVYGTLRTTEPNYSLVSALEPLAMTATVPGYRLVGWGRGFPYALPAPGRSMVGEVLTFTPEDWPNALARMDKLEGYPDFYTRRLVTVSTVVGAAVAWIYTPADPEWYEALAEVPDGDWVAADGWSHARAAFTAGSAAADLAAWWEAVK